MKKLLLLLLAIRFTPFIFGKTLFFGDNYSLLVPGKLFTAYWIHQGFLPLWNPYLLGGISWIGDLNQSLFSASTLFFSLLEPAVALNLTIIFFQIVTFVGMYAFASRFLKSKEGGLISATIWLFSSFVTGSLNNIAVLQSLSFLPWVLFFGVHYWRKIPGVIATSLAVVAMLLGGYPQFIPNAFLLAFLLSFEKKAWKRWIISYVCIGCIAVGLSAFAWMPFIETIKESTRSLQTATQAAQGGLHIPDLLAFMVPTFFADPQSGMKWGPVWNSFETVVPYVSWIGIVLFVKLLKEKKQTPRDWMFLGACVGAIIFAFATVFPFFSFLQSVVPFFKAARGPQLALVIIEVIQSIWIADLFLRTKKDTFSKRWRIAVVVPIIVCAILSMLVHGHFEKFWTLADTVLHNKLSLSAFHTVEKDALITEHVLWILSIHCLLLGLLTMAVQKKRTVLFLCFLALEMHFSTSSSLFFAPSSIYPTWSEISERPRTFERVLINNGNQPYTDFATYWDAMSIRAPFSDSYIDSTELQNHVELKRMRDGITPDWNMVYGMHSLNGYTAFIPKESDREWNPNRNEPSINTLPEISYTDPKLAKWGVSHFIVDTWFPHQKIDLPVASERGSVRTYELTNTSRFRFSDGNRIDRDLIQETPNKQRIDILSAPPDSSLIVADRFDSNWNATINGNPVVIENENGIRRIRLKEGKNTVLLTYWPKSFEKGFYISFFTLALVTVCVLLRKKIEPRNL